jgi:hypothetical protein
MLLGGECGRRAAGKSLHCNVRPIVRSEGPCFFGDAHPIAIGCRWGICEHSLRLYRKRPGGRQVIIYIRLDWKTENWWKIFVREAGADPAFHQKSQDTFDLGAPLAAIDDRKRELKTIISTETFVIRNSHAEKKIKQKISRVGA